MKSTARNAVTWFIFDRCSAHPSSLHQLTPTHQLRVKVAHAQHATRSLAHSSKCLRQKGVQRRPCCQAGLELSCNHDHGMHPELDMGRVQNAVPVRTLGSCSAFERVWSKACSNAFWKHYPCSALEKKEHNTGCFAVPFESMRTIKACIQIIQGALARTQNARSPGAAKLELQAQGAYKKPSCQ